MILARRSTTLSQSEPVISLGPRGRWYAWGSLGLLLVVILALWPRWTQPALDPGYLNDLIQHHASEWDLDPKLVAAVIQVESSGRPRAVSSKGAIGLMQLLPIAEREVHRVYSNAPTGDLNDPDYNVAMGCIYLSLQLKRFDQDAILALAAYNAGPTRIARLRREHPDLTSAALIDSHAPGETQAYWRKVFKHWGRPLPE